MNIAASEMGPVVNPFALPYVNLDDKTDLPSNPGLYFVIDGKTLLYIGRSKDLNQRWKSHHRYKQIKAIAKNPQIAFLDVDDEDLLWVERDVINRFKPVLNDTRVENNPSPKLTEDQMRRLEELKSERKGNLFDRKKRSQQESASGDEKQVPIDFEKMRSEQQKREDAAAKQKAVKELSAFDRLTIEELRNHAMQVQVEIERRYDSRFSELATELVTLTKSDPHEIKRFLDLVNKLITP